MSKKYPANEISIIRDNKTEKIDEEEIEHKKELEELEKLEQEDKKMETNENEF